MHDDCSLECLILKFPPREVVKTCSDEGMSQTTRKKHVEEGGKDQTCYVYTTSLMGSQWKDNLKKTQNHAKMV
jgi:hypothetical protein